MAYGLFFQYCIQLIEESSFILVFYVSTYDMFKIGHFSVCFSFVMQNIALNIGEKFSVRLLKHYVIYLNYLFNFIIKDFHVV